MTTTVRLVNSIQVLLHTTLVPQALAVLIFSSTSVVNRIYFEPENKFRESAKLKEFLGAKRNGLFFSRNENKASSKTLKKSK